MQDFILEENNKGTRGHSLKLTNTRCTRHRWIFFSNKVVKQWDMLDQQIVGWDYQRQLNAFKNGLDKLRKTKMCFFLDFH